MVNIIVTMQELNVSQPLRLDRLNVIFNLNFFFFFILKNIPEFHFVVQVRPNSGHLAAQMDLLKNPQCHFC